MQASVGSNPTAAGNETGTSIRGRSGSDTSEPGSLSVFVPVGPSNPAWSTAPNLSAILLSTGCEVLVHHGPFRLARAKTQLRADQQGGRYEG